MTDKRILFISQQIAPYLTSGDEARLGREVPQKMQEKGFEVRTFMPKFGNVNERRNQLHEVIRLSGMNIPINDNDHPLIIKVASMQPSRIQVYFIDNDDYFQKLDSDVDSLGSNRDDNDERAIFYARGAMETARKLRWEPSVISVTGWLSGLIPAYIRRIFADDPSFLNAKIVYSIVPSSDEIKIDDKFFDKLVEEGLKLEDIEKYKSFSLNADLLNKIGVDHADAVIINDNNASDDILEYVKASGKPFVAIPFGDGDIEALSDYFASL